MVEYNTEFAKDFLRRTSEILDQYDKYVKSKVESCKFYEATLLINCLSGMLVLPKDRRLLDSLDGQPTREVISQQSYQTLSHCSTVQRYPEDIAGLVHNLRNSVAHFDIEPIYSNGNVDGFKFKDSKNNRFQIDLFNEDIKKIVKKLKESICDGN